MTSSVTSATPATSEPMVLLQDLGVSFHGGRRPVQAVSGVKPPRRRKRAEVDPTLLRELARIGNNLNQLARWANRDKKAVEARAVIARLIEIDRELMAIREAHAPRPARNGALEADKEGTRTSDATPSGDGAPC